MELEDVVKRQKNFFEKNVTKSIKFRKQALINLRVVIDAYQNKLLEAVNKDFGKCYGETYLSEILIVKKELNYMIKNLNKFTKMKRGKTGMFTFPSKGYIIPEPYGVCLISSPWNYPINLSLIPLIGSIASGNCTILSLSNKLSHVNRVIKDMLSKVFDDEYIFVLTDGNREKLEKLISLNLDYIFFTGSKEAGKNIMRLASSNLTPVTLELGGKSPVIISSEANLDIAAKRIVWGKYLNAGQTCVAPDYVLITKELKEKLIPLLKMYIDKMYYKNEIICDNYTKIINEQEFNRLANLIKEDNILIGGQIDRQNMVIEPTVISVKSLDDESMQEEIFGPILAIVEINSIDDAINFVSVREKPLALYLFSDDKNVISRVINGTSSGSVCINDTVLQIAEKNLPFGGVGSSGMGSYHGKSSFDTFTHYKSVLKREFGKDSKLRYPPYSKNIINKIK